MDNDLTYVNFMVSKARDAMDECWIELETASTWEQIQEISVRLNQESSRYHRYKRLRAHLTNT
jgi:hypothetical protein